MNFGILCQWIFPIVWVSVLNVEFSMWGIHIFIWIVSFFSFHIFIYRDCIKNGTEKNYECFSERNSIQLSWKINVTIIKLLFHKYLNMYNRIHSYFCLLEIKFIFIENWNKQSTTRKIYWITTHPHFYIIPYKKSHTRIWDTKSSNSIKNGCSSLFDLFVNW